MLPVAKEQDLRGESLLVTNKAFHKQLKSEGYNVQENMHIYANGHAGIHALQGLQRGLQYIEEHKPARERTPSMKI